ncbi:MAG: hypothetical protein PWQ71_582 [Bacteroidota bacterium]|nr:hypothetical protein [Bacteroidota bacterium]
MEPMVWDGERNGVVFGRGEKIFAPILLGDGSDGWGDDWDGWGDGSNGWGDDWHDRGDGSNGNGRGEKFFAPTIGKSLIIIIP